MNTGTLPEACRGATADVFTFEKEQSGRSNVYVPHAAHTYPRVVCHKTKLAVCGGYANMVLTVQPSTYEWHTAAPLPEVLLYIQYDADLVSLFFALYTCSALTHSCMHT